VLEAPLPQAAVASISAEKPERVSQVDGAAVVVAIDVVVAIPVNPGNPVKKMLEVAPTPQLENVTVVVTSVAVNLYE